MRIRTASAVGLLLAAGAITLLGAGCRARAPGAPTTDAPTVAPVAVRTGIAVGDRAPNFTLTNFTGEQVSLADFRGRPVIVDFWAGWCPFCITELPALERAYQAGIRDGLVVIGVHRSEGEDQATGAAFARDRGVTFLLLQDEDDRAYRQFAGGTPAMPISAFIDRDGIIRAKVFGPKSDAQIAQHLMTIRAAR